MSIDLKRADEFAILTLNRPQSLNALSFGMLRELSRLLDEIEASDARALIVTGAGDKAFCAGADITELTGRTILEEYAGTEYGQNLFTRVERLKIPSVALVNGYALGGGCELALACTFRLATTRARFGLPEVKLGLVPGYGGTQRLPRLIGLGPALDMMMTGRFVDAEEALRVNLVHRIVDGDPLQAAITFARQFTGYSLLTLRLIREAAQRGMSTSLVEGLKIEADLSTLSMESVDGQEGASAFVEKRPARFQDR